MTLEPLDGGLACWGCVEAFHGRHFVRSNMKPADMTSEQQQQQQQQQWYAT
jgi:hypothetical protein